MRSFLYRYGLIIFFAALKIIIQLSLVPHVWELHRDEYLYLAEGLHLAWGYLEVPPVLSILQNSYIFSGTAFFG